MAQTLSYQAPGPPNGRISKLRQRLVWQVNKKEDFQLEILCSSGGWTRTNDLRVMSPTSYQLLYSAVWECKGRKFF